MQHSASYVHIIPYDWDQMTCPTSLFPNVLKLSVFRKLLEGFLVSEFDMSLPLAREQEGKIVSWVLASVLPESQESSSIF